MIKLRILDIIFVISAEDTKREAFTNDFLLNHIGLRKNASLGFGVVWENNRR